MTKGLLFPLLLLAFASPSWGQTSTDLDRKYPKVTSYEIKPGIVMIPQYAEDGNVCEMSVERHPASHILGATFSTEEAKSVIDELVPETQRGQHVKTGKYDKWLNTTVTGGFTDTEYSYENISIHIYGTTRPEPSGEMLIVIKWLKRACK